MASTSILTTVRLFAYCLMVNIFNFPRTISTTSTLSFSLSFHPRFFVVVVMLNVLIAVVSDAYDYSMTRAQQLFLRTRLQLVAELDALG